MLFYSLSSYIGGYPASEHKQNLLDELNVCQYNDYREMSCRCEKISDSKAGLNNFYFLR